MSDEKVAFNLRMTKDINKFITEEAANMGISKNAFLLFLVEMHKRESKQFSKN